MRPDWIDRFGNSTLHVAAALGVTFRDLSTIIERGADVNHVNTAGQTFMHVLNPWELFIEAPLNPISVFLEKLAQRSFDFRRRDDQGRTFLHVLNAKHKINPVHFAKWLDLLCQRDSSGAVVDYDFAHHVVDHTKRWEDPQPFMKAFNQTHQIKDKDREDKNSLHLLSEGPFGEYHERFIKELVSMGIDLDAYDNLGETPLMKCIRSSHLCGATYRKLEELSYRSSLNALLDSGANLTRRNQEFETPLHIAVKCGNIFATKELLMRGANVHARDRSGSGVILKAQAEQGRLKQDLGSYANITVCIGLVADAGALRRPSLFEEWSLPKYKTAQSIEGMYHQSLDVVKEDETNSALEEL